MQEKTIEFKKIIEKSNNILLINHIRMDPDAFWSLSGFYYILKKLWKNAKAINDEIRPESFTFLDKNQIFKPNLDLKKFNPDLIISFDAASLDQLWESYKNNKEIFDKTPFVVIDHHITNSWFWTLNIINPKYSSTCELLYDIIKDINYKKYIDKKISNLLLAWILTDTNVFYNTNVSSNTLKIASELLELWWNLRTTIFEFFKKKTIKKTKLLALSLSKINIIENKLENWKNIVYTTLTKEDFKKLWVTDRDTNWIIEHLINIENTEIAFIIYPLDKWWYKASFRSHTYDVSKIAKQLWWGWHKQAAWCLSEKNLKDFLKEIFNLL